MEDRLPEDLSVGLHPDPWARELHRTFTAMDRAVDRIVVEGGRDRAGLRACGVRSPISECATGGELYGFSRELDGTAVVLLTDYDTHGRHLNGRLRDLLSASRVVPRWRREVGLLLTQRGHYEIEALNNVFD